MADEDELAPGAGQGEARFGANLKVLREAAGISQTRFAEEMTARGWPWRQPTVSAVESGQRMVRLGEALTAAEFLGASIDRLTLPTEEMQQTEALSAWAREARGAWRQIADATAQLLRARRNLGHLHGAVAAGGDLPQAARLAQAVLAARRARYLTPDGAVTLGLSEVAREREYQAEEHGQAGTVEICPATYAETKEAVPAALRDGDVVELDIGDLSDEDAKLVLAFVEGAVSARGGEVREGNGIHLQLIPAALTDEELDTASESGRKWYA